MADLFALLAGFLSNPVAYFFLVFVFAILVAIILPIPIEVALVLPIAERNLGLFTAALFAVALGKAVGAWLVFVLGVKVEGAIHRWSERAELIAKILNALERFVRWSGSIGLYILLSIPLMSDTAVLYFYGIFNEEGKAIDRRQFILSNFLAGFNRVAVFFLLIPPTIP